MTDRELTSSLRRIGLCALVLFALMFLAAVRVTKAQPAFPPETVDTNAVEVASWKTIEFYWGQTTNVADGYVFRFGPVGTNGVPNYTTRLEIAGVTNTTATVTNVVPGKYAAGLTLYIEQPESAETNAPLIKLEGGMSSVLVEIPGVPTAAPQLKQYLITRVVFQSRTNANAEWVDTGSTAPVIIDTKAYDSELFRAKIVTDPAPGINQK